MEIDLNTKDTEEYKQWLTLLKEIRLIHETLQKNPNSEGLLQARSLAYNLLADLHDLIEATSAEESGHTASKNNLESLN